MRLKIFIVVVQRYRRGRSVAQSQHTESRNPSAVVKGGGMEAVHAYARTFIILNMSGTGLAAARPLFLEGDSDLTREKLSNRAAGWIKDEHSFRFIISPHRGNEIEMEGFVKRVMGTNEHDVKSKLEWYGVCQYSTARPLAHVVLRGVNENRKSYRERRH